MIKYILIRLVIILLVTPIVFYAILYFRQESMIFIPTKDFDESIYRFGVEDVYIQTSDNVKLHSVLLDEHEEGDYVLFFHGNAGNLSDRIWQLNFFDGLGLNVMMAEYRGYGKSEGKIRKEEKLYQDAVLAWEYLLNEKNVDPQKIIIWGRSLGASIAVDLASKKEAKALVMESSYSSIVDMKNTYYPYVPNFLIKYKMESYKKISSVECPLLLIHSSEDEMIDISHGRKIFEHANEPKEFLEIKGGHNDGVFVSETEYHDGVFKFIQSLN